MSFTRKIEEATPLTLERLRTVLRYNKRTGVFIWKITKGPIKKGTRAGEVLAEGYRQIAVDGPRYRAGRLAWFYVTGSWPRDEIDHKNLQRGDDRFSNLRESTHLQNQGNTSKRRNNTSGVKGVTWMQDRKLWRAQLTTGIPKYLGDFASKRQAQEAYIKAAKFKYVEFARS